jgi:hypothetical protein
MYTRRQVVGSTGSVFSVAMGAGNLNVAKPGKFVSTLGMDAGIALAFGGSLWDGDGDRVFALFVKGADSSRRAGNLFLSSTV